MVNYNFDSLSSYDFEILTRDLLQKHLDTYLDNFKTGRDGGIDLRASRTKDKTLIVQCKHYVNSSYASLISELKKEAKKLTVLNPTRYIVVTSQGLTQNNKEEIQRIFQPYVQSTEDIFSRDNLNNLLGQYPDIERKHYKLWLSSQNVLDRIMHNAVFNRSEIALDTIKKRISLYVQNESYFRAKEILSEMHYCIVAGAPGIGKTTLAEMLIIDYLANDYEVYKISNIDEAFRVYHSQTKQVFYYDDFLGQTSLDLKLNNKEDEDILEFITMVNKSSSTKFILTTREYILNQAKTTYEKLANSNFDIRKCVIELADYTKMDKAQILYNHIYFSGLPKGLLEQILVNKNYRKIIDHPNYSPRIIERMTVYFDGQGKLSNYFDDFISNLDNPLRIWEHAFNYQLSNVARNLLLVMSSTPVVTLRSDLAIALKSFEDIVGEKSSAKDFNRALKELEGNFIDIQRIDSDYLVSYNNPSIKDFIEYHLADNFLEFSYLCKSSVFFDQAIAIQNFESEKEEHSPLFLKCLPDFLESVARNFTSIPLQLEHTKGQDDGKIKKETVSYIDRFLYLWKLSTIIPLDELTTTLHRIEQVLYEILASSKHDRPKFLIFLDTMKNSNYQSCMGESAWVLLFKEILFRNLTDIYAYDMLTDLLSRYPAEFLDIEAIEIKNLFREFHKHDVFDYLAEVTDAEELEEYLSILENLSQFFEIDIEYLLEEIDSKRQELYEAIYEPDYDDDDRWRDYDRDRNDNEDQIDSLFDGLKD